MRVGPVRSLVFLFIVAAIFAVPTHALAADPYTVQVLVAPPGPGLSVDTATAAFAINKKGQVLGQALVAANDRRPVLWTGATPTALTVPDGFFWDGTPGHQ